MTMEEFIHDEAHEEAEKIAEIIVEERIAEVKEETKVEYSNLVKVMRRHGESAEAIADMIMNPDIFDEMALKYQAELKQFLAENNRE